MDGYGESELSHDETDRQLDVAEQQAARARRSDKRWKIGLALLLLLVLLAGAAATAWAVTSSELARVQGIQKQALAQAVADACGRGQVVNDAAGANLCDRAAELAAEPILIPGPAGPPPAQFTFTAAGREYLCIPDPPGSATFTCSAS
jgi:hypothetical protein